MGKAIEKQIKTIQDQGKKQIEALRNLKPKEETKSMEGIFLKGYESVENKNEIKLKNMKKKFDRNDVVYYSYKEPFDFKIFKTISFCKNIYSGKITINEADQEQADLPEYLLNFNDKTWLKNRNDKKNALNTAKDLYDGRELVVNAFKSRY